MVALFKPDVDSLKEKNDIEGLIKALRYKKDEHIKRSAAEALGEIINDMMVVKSLIDALENDESVLVRLEAENALVKIGEPTVIPLIEAIDNPGILSKRYCSVVLILERIGKPAVSHLITAVEKITSPFQYQLVKALGEIGDKSAIKPLERLARRIQNNNAFTIISIEAEKSLAKIRERNRNAE